jgi:hypothetical protein
MGKHATDLNKAVFLIHLFYVHQAEAARRAELAKSIAINIKNAAADIQIRYDKKGFFLFTIQKQIE